MNLYLKARTEAMNYGIVGIEFVSAVESLKTDTTRDGQKCQYYRGVRLIEVLQNFHIIIYVTPQIPLYVT